MACYEKYDLDLGPYQEGNVFTVDFEMATGFSMAGVTVTFELRDEDDNLICQKNAASGVTISGQAICIDFAATDTKLYAGKHLYEVDFLDSNSDPFATIGGYFTIEPEINKS
jgi:hypothetical protein